MPTVCAPPEGLQLLSPGPALVPRSERPGWVHAEEGARQ